MKGGGPGSGDSSVGDSSDDHLGDDSREPSPPECPHCGERMTWLTVVGPGEGYASPCGCSVEPGLLANFRED